MLVIPVVNAKNREEALRLVKTAADFARWVHVDVANGDLSETVTWGSPEELAAVSKEVDGVKFEVHLMVGKPDLVLEDWLKAGVSRVIFQEETIGNFKNILALCEKYGVEPMLSVDFKSGKASKKTALFKALQVLAVSPGPAGQEFDEKALAKIKLLREMYPSAKIEVDGGINLVTARKAKAAGADIVVSSSYVFGNENPREAYGKLELA